MANVKQLRLRIKSIKSTKKITKAMQMVSAAKLRKARIALDNSGIYHNVVETAMHNVLGADADLSILAKAAFGLKAISRVKLLILVSSDRGLCGSFNHAVFRMFRADIAKYMEDKVPFKIITIGKKSSQFVEAHYSEYLLSAYNNLGFSVESINKLAHDIVHMLSGKHDNHSIGSCNIYFSTFKNVMTQMPTQKQLLPIEIKKSEHGHHEICEVEGENIVDELIGMYITAQLQYALLTSRAGEEAARTNSMDNATRNAEEMVDKLTLVMNRNRQAMITKELIEIISGADAAACA